MTTIVCGTARVMLTGRSKTKMASNVRTIESLDKADEWVSVKVKVIQLWDPNSDSMSQVGLLGDETSKIKFVSWKKSNLPLLEEGKNYLIQGVIVDSWNGKFQINLNIKTKISPLDGKLKVRNDELTGRIIKIIPKSGYIERCPECNRVLVNDHCVVHVEVEPIEDIRIKLSLNNNSKIILVNGELAEQMLGLNLEQARKMEEGDLENLMDIKFIGKEYWFMGKEFEENFLVKSFEEIGG